MDDPYTDTKDKLKTWLKASFKHLKELREAFSRETKNIIDEVRKEYEEKK